MKPILKWQYDKLVMELILLQDHQADPDCPCDTDGEMCVRKHLLTIEAYAQETVAMEDDPDRRRKLEELAVDAKQHRTEEEKALCGEGEHVEILSWARQWRKAFEQDSLACELHEPSEGATCALS